MQPTARNLLDIDNRWRLSPGIYCGVNADILAQASVLRQVQASAIATLENLYSMPATVLNFMTLPMATYLMEACARVSLTPYEIEKRGYFWNARVAPIADLQKKGIMPSMVFVRDSTEHLLEAGNVFDCYAEYIARRSSHQLIWAKRSKTFSLKTLAHRRQNVHEEVIADHLDTVDACARRLLCNMWVKTAGDITDAKVGLRDYAYGYEKTLAENATRRTPVERNIHDNLTGLDVTLKQLNIFLNGTDDVDLKDRRWCRALAYKATHFEPDSRGTGFIIEITSANAHLAGTRLQLAAFAKDWFDSICGGGSPRIPKNSRRVEDDKGRVYASQSEGLAPVPKPA